MPKRFQKKIENFTCGRCGGKVKGTGYTNHCPNCLWSKHVDVNPGDRSAICGGLMEPVKIKIEKNEYILTHKCQKCGLEKRNKLAKNDNMEEVIRLSKTLANL